MAKNRRLVFSFLAVIAGLIFLYWPSFASPFFQDDFELLAKSGRVYLFSPVPDYHFHPVSNQLFFGTGKLFLGENPTGYHLLLFTVNIATVILVYKLAEELLKNQGKALTTAIFFAFNVSLFANYYWVAISYFVFGGFFFFLTIFWYLQRERIFAFSSLLSFLLAAGSNELAIMATPLTLILVSWYKTYWPRRLWLFLFLGAILLFFKLSFVGLSPESVYRLQFDFSAIKTFQWYLLRAFNLPEGVRNTTNNHLYGLFFVFVFLLLWLLPKINRRVFLLGAGWFVFGALPFFFLPNHMSSYYLTFALFGPTVVFGEVFQSKWRWLAVVTYLLLSFFGLEFLSRSHWIILKPS